jgi:fatty-acyl-CoA synthase
MKTIDWLAKHSLYTPDRTAVVESATGRSWTYLEFNDAACRTAGFLRARGVKPGHRVAVLSHSCAEILFTLFACQKAGAIFLPLNFRLPIAELLPIVEEAGPALLLFHEDFQGAADELGVPRWNIRAVTDSEPDGRFEPVDWNEPQMILYTSGTTGRPKGAMLSHRMNLWNAINFSVRDLWPSDTVLVHSPMFYTGGLNVVTLPIFFLGGRLILMKGWNADEAIEAIERERVTVFFAVPTQFLTMTESPRWATADLASLRYVIGGGAPMPGALIEKILDRGLVYKQGFGMTEAGVNCFALEGRDARRKIGSIGFPNFSIEARIVAYEGDDEGQDVPRSSVGELLLRTPAMIDGYWKNPEATAAALRDGWFHSGDLARQDEDGYFYIAGRKKDMYISGGENVYPAEIENLLSAHHKIAEVAVVGVPHEKWGEVGCAAVVLKAGATAEEAEVIEFLRGKLAKYKIPKSVMFVPELPRTHSGKVQKQEICRMAMEEKTEARRQMPE